LEIELGLTLARRVDHNEARLVEYSEEPPQPPDRILLEAEGTSRVEGQIVTSCRVETMRLSVDDQPVMYRGHRLRIRFAARDLPPLGYRLYQVIATSVEDATSPEPVGSGGATPPEEQEVWIENELLRVNAEDTGTMRVLDKRTGIEYSGLLALEDGGDAGDEYTYCPPAADRRVVVTTAEDGSAEAAGTEAGSIRAAREDEHTLRISGTMMLPRALTRDRSKRSDATVACPFSITVRLHPGHAQVDLQVEFTNYADDHILKIAFPTGLHTDRSMAGGTFCVDERRFSPDSLEDYLDWMERPSGVYPQKSFVTVSDGTRAITVASRGLPEYEFRPASPSAPKEGTSIAVTLLRCVGYLSRPDLACRPGNAGWPLNTPGAQCRGSHRFDLALLIHSDSDSRLIPALSRVFLTPP
ncbi:MAG: hypothetical protein KAU31_14665, partial [Spirochaetaceae bacterium]|nr:hypothetical protein [Spirochaetaceae bacterium]